MTSTTATATKVFLVSYSVTSYHTVTVERPADITKQELISSITKNELVDGESNGEWDGLKDAWRQQDVSLIMDEDHNEVEFL